MPIIQLTAQFIRNHLTCPDNKSRIEYCDQTIPGLYIEVRRTTPKQGTYYLRYKNRLGKTSHQRIGKTDALNLTDARTAARKLKHEIATGNDPKLESPLQPETLTFKYFMEEKYLPHAVMHKRYHRFDQSMCKLWIIPKFGHLPLNAITRQEVQSFHSDLHDEGLGTRNL